jgi:hypothetical protein
LGPHIVCRYVSPVKVVFVMFAMALRSRNLQPKDVTVGGGKWAMGRHRYPAALSMSGRCGEPECNQREITYRIVVPHETFPVAHGKWDAISPARSSPVRDKSAVRADAPGAHPKPSTIVSAASLQSHKPRETTTPWVRISGGLGRRSGQTGAFSSL